MLAIIVINNPTITMATATYIGVLSVSLEVDPTAPLLCVGEGLGVWAKSAVTVSVAVCNVTVAVTMTNSVVVVLNSVVVNVTIISSSRPELVPAAVPLML